MKYVIFAKQIEGYGGRLCFPLLLPEPCTHSQVKVEEMEPIAAGFFNPSTGEVYDRSESLDLDNRGEKDERLIGLSLMSSDNTSFFLEWDDPDED